jgi:transcription initiation factor TFIID TATA-box-binding protein
MRELLDFDYEPNSEVTNIVVTTELESTILLEALAVELGLESVEYEPEQFPGLIYRGQDHVC